MFRVPIQSSPHPAQISICIHGTRGSTWSSAEGTRFGACRDSAATASPVRGGDCAVCLCCVRWQCTCSRFTCCCPPGADSQWPAPFDWAFPTRYLHALPDLVVYARYLRVDAVISRRIVETSADSFGGTPRVRLRFAAGMPPGLLVMPKPERTACPFRLGLLLGWLKQLL